MRIQLDALSESWERSLRAKNLSDNTIDSYLLCLRLLREWLETNGLPTDPALLTRQHIESYIAFSLATRSANTAGVRFRSLKQFFKWLQAEEEIQSPMAHMTPPAAPEPLVPVVPDSTLKALLEVCGGHRYEDRRDAAITRLFIDTPCRISEVTHIQMDDLDLRDSIVRVLGKGGKERVAPFGPKTGVALDRYLRVRSGHRFAESQSLWLGREGPMTRSGLDQMLKSRCRQAGIAPLHWHQLRHTFAHQWLAAGGSDNDLMRLAGWSSRAMLAKYGASLADERARESYRDRNPGDRI